MCRQFRDGKCATSCGSGAPTTWAQLGRSRDLLRGSANSRHLLASGKRTEATLCRIFPAGERRLLFCFPLAEEAEEILSHATHLDLFRSLCDAIPAMMTIIAAILRGYRRPTDPRTVPATVLGSVRVKLRPVAETPMRPRNDRPRRGRSADPRSARASSARASPRRRTAACCARRCRTACRHS